MVWKHNPLPFHERARPTHEVAAAVYMLAGATAFFRFHDRAFGNQQALTPENLQGWAADVGVSREALHTWLDSGKPASKVSEDMQVARDVGASGTPAFRINGVTLSGAQPLERFRAIIDEQLAAAQELTSTGTPARAVYALLTAKNFVEPPPPAADVAEEEADTTVWQVPVLADDPQRGPKDALVTLVECSEYQCPFCKRVEATLSKLRELYPKDLRIVWKDNPLPFHARAMPAALFARFAYKKAGNQAFWRLHDALFENQPELGEEDFEDLATKQGLLWAQVQAELGSKQAEARINESIELASDFQARGTPHFFINGRRLSGAQPLEKFTKLIDEELLKARALTERGVPRAKVYAELMKTAQGPEPAERKQVPLLSDAPSRGDAKARVVIQIFSDFQCPFCKRVEPTLAVLEQEFKGQIRLVWRHLPLPFHQDAQLAAEAAEEVRAQLGDAAFWKYRDLLFEAQGEDSALKRPNLSELARKLGVDPVRFELALDKHVHTARVTGDATIANAAGINGTPAFVINDYYLSGAQPAGAFRKLIKLALKDRAKPPGHKAF
jgi:protein-disulfide isomerase